MCMGALLQARIKRLVYGASDPKAGAAGSVMDLSNLPELNHAIEIQKGILQDECAEILRAFLERVADIDRRFNQSCNGFFFVGNRG